MQVADRIRDVLDQYKETIPTVLEIPSKNNICDSDKDIVIKKVKVRQPVTREQK